ncbi:ankyrin repeat domain-containing protein (plasmid) [Ralstonia pseudosolanacearum]|uniref:ankyrin repeat domain-containing protein n=1 Tax=Ralstonia pseudosolanacearum TaxID=1310165 RepID=UPI0018688C16|nr:ankyrin repeat domain-containing protein [Ralstonia pseudosolanacearum]QOK94593.1 ankyrin repeat domain-containing protein [Ralstonia pseudosolanacearum]
MLKVTPNFLRPGTGTSAPAEPYHNEKAVSYQSEQDGTSMADFEASPKGKRVAGQYRAGIDKLKDFLRVNGTAKRDESIHALGEFGKRIEAGHAGMYSTQISRMYGEGKVAFDGFCSDVGNPAIPMGVRVSAVEDLAKGLLECSEGTASNLGIAAQALHLSQHGLLNHARQTWEALLDQAVREFAQQQHRGMAHYELYEIHLANGYRNHLAEEYGVAGRVDSFVPPEVGRHLAACQAFVRQRVTAGALVRRMAEACLGEVHERLKPYCQRALTADEAWQFYGDYDKSLEAALEMRYGTIPSDVLINPHQGRGTEDAPYSVIENPTLLARTIARNLRQCELLAPFKFLRMASTPDGHSIKDVGGGDFYVKIRGQGSEKGYRPLMIADLHKSVWRHGPIAVRKAALMNTTDPGQLKTLEPEAVWTLIRQHIDPMGWLEDLSHPAVRRYREAEPKHDAFLIAYALVTIRKQSSGGQQMVLLRALRQGERVLAEQLCAAMDHVDREDEAGNTALHYAAEHGFDTLLAELLPKSEALDARNARRETPLMLAARHGKASAVGALVVAGASVRKRSAKGETAFFLAARVGDAASVGVLSQHVTSLDDQVASGKTALMAASENGHESVVTMLLSLRAKPNKGDNDAMTPLIAACRGGHLGCVLALINAGAKRDLYTSSDRSTALIEATRGRHFACAEALVNAGVNVNAFTKDGTTALMAAVDAGHMALVRLLIPKARLNQFDSHGKTALMRAVARGNAEGVSALLQADARVDLPKAMLLALKHGHVEVVDVLDTWSKQQAGNPSRR